VGVLGVGVAVRAAEEDPLSPAGPVAAVLAVGLLFAALAYWQQHEGWAAAAGATVNLAATLLIADLERAEAAEVWWVWLVQTNIIAGAATTLVWLALRRHLFRDRPEEIDASPVLSVKVAVDLAANALLLVGPVVLLVLYPG